jgi:hypothetical protein
MAQAPVCDACVLAAQCIHTDGMQLRAGSGQSMVAAEWPLLELRVCYSTSIYTCGGREEHAGLGNRNALGRTALDLIALAITGNMAFSALEHKWAVPGELVTQHGLCSVLHSKVITVHCIPETQQCCMRWQALQVAVVQLKLAW